MAQANGKAFVLTLPTQDELDAMRERHAATTQGEWVADISRPGPGAARCPREALLSVGDSYPEPRIFQKASCDLPHNREMIANFDFAAAAHQDLPMLVAAYEAVIGGLMGVVGSLLLIENLAGNCDLDEEAERLALVRRHAESARVAAQSFLTEYERDKPASV